MAVGGESPPKISYVMAELDDMDGVFLPIKTASRVKYTCFDVSQRYIIFGTTAGGVIMLQHDGLSYLKTLAVKEGPVCQAALAPDESMVGFSTSRGITIVMEHNADRGTTPPQRLQLSYEHKGSLITALQWNISSSKLFVSDDRGKVSVINVTTSRTRNIFQVPTATLVKLDSKVVQLDYAQDHLLVSTLTRCYLCDTNREQFLQIGKKLRDGEYGVCFYPGSRSNDPCTIYSARPGSRMWEVNIKGEVHCTHQFKAALAIQPEKVLTFRNELNLEVEKRDMKPHATVFNKMLLIWPGSEDLPFVFTWSEIAAYIFNPRKAEVVLWTEDLNGIKDARCQRGNIYIHFKDGRFMKYSLMTIEHAVCRLYQHGLAIHGAQLLFLKQASLCASRLNIHVPPSFLLDMLQSLSDMGKTYLFNSLSAVYGRLGLSPDKLSQSSRSSSAMSEPLRLTSGMYVVKKHSRDLEETASVSITRWRSASPVLRHMGGSPHSSPPRQSGMSSPRRKRSGTLPTVKLKDTRDKVSSVSSDHTPDSLDSGTSGKASDLSDETYSSTSGRDLIGSLQSFVISDPPVPTTSDFASASHNGGSVNGVDKVIVGNLLKSNENIRGNSSDSPKKISLNLSDISKESCSSGKKVSFVTKSQEKPTAKVNGVNNATAPDLHEANERTCLSNGFASAKNDSGYDVGEDAILNSYSDRFFDETHNYMNMSLYGMMVPNVDWSLLFGADKDFLTIKESLTNKLATGKNLLKRGLEHLKQTQTVKPEPLDVRSKVSVPSHAALALKIAEPESMPTEKQEKNIWSFLPAFDATELIDTTRNARAKVRDAEVLFNPKKLKIALEEWTNCLHAAQKSVITSINNYCHSSYSGSHSCREDDTIKSTCSQVTSAGSSPSENGGSSLKLETEEASISESKSYEDDKHLESMSSLNTDGSDTSTLKTESLQKMLNNEDFVFNHDPFRLPKEDHQLVSELVMLCFITKVWGNVHQLKDRITIQRSRSDTLDRSIPEEREVSNDYALNSKTSDVFMNGVDKASHDKSLHLSLPRTSTPKQLSSCDHMPSSTSLFNQFDGSMHSFSLENVSLSHMDFGAENAVKLEKETHPVVLFIQNYFHFLDLQRLRELLIVKNEPCMLVWTIMLRGAALCNLKDEFTQKINSGQLDSAANLLERNYSGPVLISHLLRLFRAKPSRTIELCLQRSYQVTPLDVLYLTKSCNMPAEFINYVTCIIESLSEHQRPKVIEKVLHLDEVRWEWISGMLQGGTVAELKCKCGWPRPGSHLHEWKYSLLIFHIVNTATNLFEKLLPLCFHYGYWPGYVCLAKKLNVCDNVKQVIIQLSDSSLLSNESDIGYLPSTSEDWRELFHLMQKWNCFADSVSCISCGEKYSTKTNFCKGIDDCDGWTVSLSWESAFRKALAKLGPIVVTALLRDVELPPGVLSSRFYSAIIMQCVLEKQQSALSHRMLTNVGTYLWSRRPSTFPPEIDKVFQKEKASDESKLSGDEKVKEEPAITVMPKSYMEEPQGHWGRNFCLRGLCKLCKMPLISHLSEPASGVTFCPCGHAYHTACLRNGLCMACLNAPK